MALSYLEQRYTINGFLQTSEKVITNLNLLADSCGVFLTYDINEGHWAVVINRAGNSIASFDDSNIIGSISISGIGLDQLYNSVKVNFPHIDLNSTADFVEIDVPTQDYYPNEQFNQLQLSMPLINDPIQASLIGFLQLKQGRVDKVIKFTTDYSMMGIKAGDLIDVTNSILNYNKKMFRIISSREVDPDNGSIQIELTALEYDATVYDTDFTRYPRTTSTGIMSIGAIPAPADLTIDKIENDPRPRVEFTTTITSGGLVEGVEFWISTDTTIVDENRKYNLSGTVKANVGNTFAAGETVKYSVDTLNASNNFHAKARSINGVAVSPFTNPADFIFNPQQTTSAIGPNTKVVDSNGLSTLLGLTSAAALIRLLSRFFGGNTSIASEVGGLFDKVFSIFKDKTGTDILGNAAVLGNIITKGNSIPSFATLTLTASTYTVEEKYAMITGTSPIAPDAGGWPSNRSPSNAVRIPFTLPFAVSTLQFIVQTPLGNYSYQYYDVNDTLQTYEGFIAFVPSEIRLYKNGVQIQFNTSDWQTNNTIIQIGNAQPGNYEFMLWPLVTYDLIQSRAKTIFPYNIQIYQQASGGGVTITAYGFTT